MSEACVVETLEVRAELSKTTKKHTLNSLRIAAMCTQLRDGETRIDVALDVGHHFDVTKGDLELVLSMSVQEALEFQIL